ncbi:MAG: ABC transporter permease, partial [Cellulosilyticaceae bacterium]
GITNTMMMSIYERTKEIGVMKVIGAKLTDIKKMFLMEALMIGAIGGTVGVIFSYGISFIMNQFGPQIAASLMMGGGGAISEIPVWLAGAALVFSTLIGLVSGYFPARRAMKLSALSAIRTE